MRPPTLAINELVNTKYPCYDQKRDRPMSNVFANRLPWPTSPLNPQILPTSSIGHFRSDTFPVCPGTAIHNTLIRCSGPSLPEAIRAAPASNLPSNLRFPHSSCTGTPIKCLDVQLVEIIIHASFDQSERLRSVLGHLPRTMLYLFCAV